MHPLIEVEEMDLLQLYLVMDVGVEGKNVNAISMETMVQVVQVAM